MKEVAMNLTVPAVYENGVFRPVGPVPPLVDGTAVMLIVQDTVSSEDEEAKTSLSSKEIRELIRSKNPHAEQVPEEEWAELDRLLQLSLSNFRDPEAMRQAAERMDRRSEEIYRRQGLLDIAVPYLREARNEE
jgi:predicted DNA-binding antitoxin AbrB/MazE fold protein